MSETFCRVFRLNSGALELGKPLIVMPRSHEFREHRNNHQFAIVAHLGARATVRVATDAEALAKDLDEMASWGVSKPIAPSASPQLLNAIRFFVNSGADLVTDPVLATE